MDQSKKQKTSTEFDFACDSSASSSSSSNLREDQVSSGKVYKADREKLRRDRLKEQFLELGNTLDLNRTKSDKASILTDTVQMLKDLMAQVDELKAEYAMLSQESRELMREKSELREEKASLRSEIETLNTQYQHRVKAMVPWVPVDPSLHYSYPIPIAISQGPISMQPQLQPFPFYTSQDPTAIPKPCSNFIPYSASVNSPMEQDSKSTSLDLNLIRNTNLSDEDNDQKNVALELDLKIPAFSAQQDISEKEKERSSTTSGNSYSSYSSSQTVQDSSSEIVNDILKP